MRSIHMNKKNSFASRKDRRFGNHFVDYYTCSLGYGRKKRPRIRYLEWAQGKVDFCSPFEKDLFFSMNPSDSPKDIELETTVEKALDKLNEEEKRFIQYFYYDCFSYEKISQILGKRKYKLEKIHKDAKEKLKLVLKSFVKKRFGISLSLDASAKDMDCIICKSPHTKKLDELIKKKKKNQTWSRLIKLFKKDYGVNIKTPQILITHQKKHMVK